MRKGRDVEKNGKKNGGKKREENTDENTGHYVIASSRPPERPPLERHTLAPIGLQSLDNCLVCLETLCNGQEFVWKVFVRCLKEVKKVSISCLEGVWKVFRRF